MLSRVSSTTYPAAAGVDEKPDEVIANPGIHFDDKAFDNRTGFDNGATEANDETQGEFEMHFEVEAVIDAEEFPKTCFEIFARDETIDVVSINGVASPARNAGEVEYEKSRGVSTGVNIIHPNHRHARCMNHSTVTA